MPLAKETVENVSNIKINNNVVTVKPESALKGFLSGGMGGRLKCHYTLKDTAILVPLHRSLSSCLFVRFKTYLHLTALIYTPFIHRNLHRLGRLSPGLSQSSNAD